jgi:hypothetical protein
MDSVGERHATLPEIVCITPETIAHPDGHEQPPTALELRWQRTDYRLRGGTA